MTSVQDSQLMATYDLFYVDNINSASTEYDVQ